MRNGLECDLTRRLAQPKVQQGVQGDKRSVGGAPQTHTYRLEHLWWRVRREQHLSKLVADRACAPTSHEMDRQPAVGVARGGGVRTRGKQSADERGGCAILARHVQRQLGGATTRVVPRRALELARVACGLRVDGKDRAGEGRRALSRRREAYGVDVRLEAALRLPWLGRASATPRDPLVECVEACAASEPMQRTEAGTDAVIRAPLGVGLPAAVAFGRVRARRG